MALLQTKSNSQSNNCSGEVVARRAVVLASAYVVDRTSILTGFHYSTTGADGAQCPPLAAFTSANELAYVSAGKSRRHGDDGTAVRGGRAGGAAHSIREECERLFCETMTTVFLGERDSIAHGSYEWTANAHSPPQEGMDGQSYFKNAVQRHNGVGSWLELWDYAGGCSFKGFVAGADDERCLFTFFDHSVINRDLKQALMAIIDLASSPLGCSQVVVCLDRSISAEDSKSLLKSLRWVGFELVTLDLWAESRSSPSNEWLFLGMEL
ncbi:hypothetical protein VE01_04714 [Pseudogymnoascus verrucosus]|uniref:Ornithine decarboxylase antizyme n=1 Tax=Pseudogymnoascus verrucosus TaxID=342668 RepID=A0A1B8GN30_9PEZI|nr:uncharacterized protein VE01_04714 [Pseudogymnoascus verrucosus]OBT97250.1 hypothetical protein VE01_04714 [Pseudogymnoascus verrucosus]